MALFQKSVENVKYTEKAVKGKNGININQSDSLEEGEIKVNPKHTRSTSRDEGEMRRLAVSPLHSDAVNPKSVIGSHHQRQGGLRYASNKPELEAVNKGSDMHRPREQRQVSREEGDMRRPVDSNSRGEKVNQKSAQNSPYHRHGGTSGGETPKKVGRQSGVGLDRSIEHSPLHPHSQAKAAGGKGGAMSSPSWERKGLSEGGHGLSPSTPGRSRLRSITKGDDTSDQGPVVPKFGDWNENDPSSAEGYTGIFDKVREEKQSGTGKVPMMPNQSSYANGHKRISSTTSKGCGCGCFPWSR